MARMPDIPFRPAVSSSAARMRRWDVVCIHTIVGPMNGGAMATFGTGGSPGQWVQWRDTIYQSGANWSGNYRVIAIENADVGPEFPKWDTNGSDVPAFTDWQIEAQARICAWAHQVHGIPLQLITDSKPTSRGIAAHRAGIEGFGLGPGGERWSKARRKVCPGERRIAQIPQIIARARELAGKEEFDMNKAQNDALAEIWQTVVSGQKRDAQINRDLGFVLEQVMAQIKAVAGSLTAQEARLLAALKAEDEDQVDVQQLANALVPLLPPAATEDDVVNAVRQAFTTVGGPNG